MTNHEKSNILVSELQNLYSIYELRINAIEKRLPVSIVIISALLGSFGVLPGDVKMVYLLGIPVLLLHLAITTKTHIQSFEDLLRRIEEIELKINTFAGEDLLTFQSKHSSKKKTVGGRFGRESSLSILILSLLVLSACVYISFDVSSSTLWRYFYIIYSVTIAAYISILRLKMTKYKYTQNS